MLVFPQLSTGTSAHYPVGRRRSTRTIKNVSEDGRITALSDQAACQIYWNLSYAGLSDSEVSTFLQFYQACEGRLQSFLFIDPTMNLFAYSENLTQPAWTRSLYLQLTQEIDDPFATRRASRLTNTSAGLLSITQTVAIPGSVRCAFSVYLRGNTAPAAGSYSLARTDGSTVETDQLNLSASWTRCSLETTFASSVSETCDFSLSIPPDSYVDIFGFQLEAQPSPGKYVQAAVRTGLFPQSRFDSEELSVTATGPGESSLKLSIVSNAQ